MTLYSELAKTVSKNWLDCFKKAYANRGFTEKVRTREDFVVWLVQVGLFECSEYPVGEDSPWS